MALDPNNFVYSHCILLFYFYSLACHIILSFCERSLNMFVHLFQWPDRIFHCESGVTALDFSACNANQLAVGMYDGTIGIYNVQAAEQTPIIDSRWGCEHFFSSAATCRKLQIVK